MNVASTDSNSEVLKKYEEVWSGVKDCIEKINDGKDYMKIKFSSDDDLPWSKQ